MKQIANVAALPGIVGRSVGLPDIHSGYGFAIGNMAAFDMSDPKAVVSPGEPIENFYFYCNQVQELHRSDYKLWPVQKVSAVR